jgi:hypothetical protein
MATSTASCELSVNSLINILLYSHTCFCSPRPRQNRALSPAGNAMWHNTKGSSTTRTRQLWCELVRVTHHHAHEAVMVCTFTQESRITTRTHHRRACRRAHQSRLLLHLPHPPARSQDAAVSRCLGKHGDLHGTFRALQIHPLCAAATSRVRTTALAARARAHRKREKVEKSGESVSRMLRSLLSFSYDGSLQTWKDGSKIGTHAVREFATYKRVRLHAYA